MILRPFARVFADPIYRNDYIAICSRDEDFIPTARKCAEDNGMAADDIVANLEQHTTAGCAGRCWRLEPKSLNGSINACVVMWFRPGWDISVVTHEAWHAAFWVFQQRGVHLDAGVTAFLNGADEPMAYYLQWLVRSTLDLHSRGRGK